MGDCTKHNGTQYYCYICLHSFTQDDLKRTHETYCRQHAAQIIQMPNEQNNILKFNNIYMQHPIAFTIYADFESLLLPISTATLTTQM